MGPIFDDNLRGYPCYPYAAPVEDGVFGGEALVFEDEDINSKPCYSLDCFQQCLILMSAIRFDDIWHCSKENK